MRKAKWSITLFVSLVALSAAVHVAHAAKLREIFPEYEARKPSLGSIAVLADVVVIREEGGSPIMRRARSAEYADSVLALVKESLAGKGLEVKGARLASMGIIFADDRGFRVTDNDSVPAIELVNPPFFVDSTLAATPELEKKWRGLNRTLANYTRRKKDAAVSHAPAVAIASAYDAQALAIVRVVVWDVPIGKQLASFFDFSTPDVRKSTAFVGLTIVNGTDGLILWDDWQRQEKSLRLEGLRGVVAGFASRLP